MVRPHLCLQKGGGSSAPDIGAGYTGVEGSVFVILPKGKLIGTSGIIGNDVVFSASPASVAGIVTATLSSPFGSIDVMKGLGSVAEGEEKVFSIFTTFTTDTIYFALQDDSRQYSLLSGSAGTGNELKTEEAFVAFGEKHTWGEWIVTTPPTHDGPGEETRTCNDCDETQTRDVPATGPVLVSYTVYYYSQGTTTSLAPSKVVSGQTMDTSVTESAITITGYTVVAPASVTANLNATNIAFIFYYTVNSGGSGGSSGSSSGSSSSSSSKASTPSTVPLDDGDGADDVVVQPYDGDLPPAEINEDESLPAWSLVSLVLSVAGVILAVILVVAVLMWRRNQKQTVLKHGQTLWFFLGLILGIAGILVFFLTEDLSRTMSIVGQWTAVNAIIFIVQVIAVVFTFKLYKTTNSNRTNDNNSTA